MYATALLESCVDKALRESPLTSLRRLRVEETDEEVVLTGTVSSYYLKQMAQETILPVLGRRELLNRVKVIQDRN